MKLLDPKDWIHVEYLRSENKTGESHRLKGYQECPQGFEGCLHFKRYTGRELFCGWYKGE